MASKHRMTMLAVLLAGMGSAGSALAGLGPIHVLSSDGQPFEAEIAVVDEDPQGSVLVNLADRNKYPLLSTYSPSASALKFSAIHKPDGSIQKILVKGPAHFDETLVRFAVEMNWPAGRLVREFEVDPVRDGPPRKDKPPVHDDTVKKAAVSPDQMPRLSSLGLGELSVKSRLGEPLEAEMELFGSALKETQNVRVALSASADQGLPSAEQLQMVASITHQLVKSPSGKHMLQLRSSKPMNEPVLTFRLEVGAANVHAQKRYTLLLDPNGYSVEEQALPSGNGEASPAAKSRPHPLKVYRVLPGDTLSGIAARVQGGISPAEAAKRMHNANPGAFIAGDVNRLRAGSTLKYPADWKLNAGAGGNADMAAAPPVVPAKAEAPVKANAAPAVSKPQTPPPAVKAAASMPQVTAVKAVTPGAASTAGQESKLKATLAMQDQALLQAQQKAQDLEQKIRNLQAAKAAAASAPAAQATQAKPEASQAAVQQVAPAPVAAPASAPAQPKPAVASAPHKLPPAKPAAVPPPQPSMLDDVLDGVRNNSDSLMYGGGAIAALGALLVAQRLRKRKQAEQAGTPAANARIDNASMLTMGPLTTLMSGLKRGDGIDLGSVDLIAEAEVYLAYGRIDQALDILREGLTREPMRQDLRYKLLEVLAMQPDKDGFIAEATTARGIFGKDSTLWMRVCELGRTLAPEHPLFEGAAVPAGQARDLEPVRVASQVAATSDAVSAVSQPEAMIDLAAELGALPDKPEPPLDLDFLDKPAGKPAPLPPAVEQNGGMSGLDAFASLGEQELEDAVKQAPEPMLDMDFLSDLPSSEPAEPPKPAPASAAATPKSQSEANEKMELAKLYLEMGDKETAEALMKEAGQVV
ncbi:MAG: pilus assembly protein FimV [Aquitalea sp.]|nr:pilus assembly protein FimV [Aquitalea sp.]